MAFLYRNAFFIMPAIADRMRKNHKITPSQNQQFPQLSNFLNVDVEVFSTSSIAGDLT